MTLIASDEDRTLGDVLIGQSAAMRQLRDLVLKVAPLELPVLIQGPTGAGKELVAAMLHRHSGRPGPLVAFNVCAVAESLLEDALFGHVRGAFTGALRDAPGYLLEADHGTIFLDEINGMPLHAQAKLLRAIETGAFRPLGGARDRQSAFRVVAASNEDIDRLIAHQRFRADLAQRLRGATIRVPTLRQRLEDIPLLVTHIVRSRAPGAREWRFSADALDRLRQHDWPGNVRELQHVVLRAIAFAVGGSVTAVDVAMALEESSPASAHAPSTTYLELEQREHLRQQLLTLLEETDGNVLEVARRCHVSRSTLYRRLRELDVPTPKRRHPTVPRSEQSPSLILTILRNKRLGENKRENSENKNGESIR